jgi:hypothetical protein
MIGKFFIWAMLIYWGMFFFITGSYKTLPANGLQSNRPLIPVLKQKTYDQLNQLFGQDQPEHSAQGNPTHNPKEPSTDPCNN